MYSTAVISSDNVTCIIYMSIVHTILDICVLYLADSAESDRQVSSETVTSDIILQGPHSSLATRLLITYF